MLILVASWCFGSYKIDYSPRNFSQFFFGILSKLRLPQSSIRPRRLKGSQDILAVKRGLDSPTCASLKAMKIQAVGNLAMDTPTLSGVQPDILLASVPARMHSFPQAQLKACELVCGAFFSWRAEPQSRCKSLPASQRVQGSMPGSQRSTESHRLNFEILKCRRRSSVPVPGTWRRPARRSAQG